VIRARAAELRLHLNGIKIIEPATFPRLAEYTEEFYSLRQRKGITRTEAETRILNPVTFGSMMVRLNDADAIIGGLTTHYPDTIRPALEVIEVRPEVHKVAGVYVLITAKGDLFFLADATVNIEPTAEDLEPQVPRLRRLLAAPDTTSTEQPMTLQLGVDEVMALIAPGSNAFEQVSRSLQERFDVVLWDLPPPGHTTPTAVAARQMDGVILVVQNDRTTRRALRYATERLRSQDAHILGVVLNRVRRRLPRWLDRIS